MRFFFVFFAMVLAPTLSLSQPLGLPVLCDIGKTCFIGRYVDHSIVTHPAQDYTCGTMSAKGYAATDFNVIYGAEHSAPSAVLAAADGTVKAVRRHLHDMVRNDFRHLVVPAGMEAGNSVIIDHGNGWETQYNHLKFGAITVSENMTVKAGDKIAEMGSSGMTKAPKLGFVVRHNGNVIDPFVGDIMHYGCQEETKSVWLPEAKAELAYQETGVTRLGFTEQLPTVQAIRGGLKMPAVRDTAPEGLVFWVNSFGVYHNDVVHMRITDPTGQIFSEHEEVIRADYPQYLAYTGRKINTGRVTPGVYVAEFLLERGHRVVLNEKREIRLH